MTLCSCEIRADADGVRGVPVVGITVVVDIAEIRRRLDGPYRGHPIFLVFQMLQETVVRLPQCLDHVEQDRKSTRLNSSHSGQSRMPSSA